MTITVEVQGLAQVQAALRKFGADAEKEIGKAITATALEVNSNVKKAILRGPKSGRTYTEIFRMINGRAIPVGPRSGNNLSASHTASAPGQAPATDTGTLAGSIYFTQDNPLQATIGSRLAYAYYLEYGTTRMAARPAWQPETEKGQKALMARIEKALHKASQRAAP